MEISQEAAMKRCQREGWLSSPEARIANRNAIAQRSGITVSPQMSATAVLQAELSQLGQKTRLSLARGIAKAGEAIEALDGPSIVADAQNVKAIAQTASTVHSWDRQGGAPKIRLELLANKSEVSAVEIESEVVTDDWADEY